MKALWTLANTTLDRAATLLPDPLLLGIRLYWGWQFFLTGKGKLGDLGSTTEFFTGLGLPFPGLNAFIAGATECFGGLLLLAGLFTRPVCVPLIFTMLVAYATAHREELLGIWQDSDAFVSAAPFLFLLACLVVFTFGPGRWSVDGLLGSYQRATKKISQAVE